MQVSSNGFITFGTVLPAATLTAPISAAAAYDGAVSAFGGDLSSFSSAGKAGEMRWEMVGAAPNREVVIQWSNFRPNSSTVTTTIYTFGFQIRLREDGSIQTVYNAGSYLAGTTAISSTRQIGLRGESSADFNNRLSTTSTAFDNSTPGTTDTSSQAFNTVNNPPGMPTPGLAYTWTPPSCFSPSALSSTATTTTSGTVIFTAAAPAPADGYDIYYSTTPTAPTAGTVLDATNSITSTGTTATINNLTPGTIYYFWVRAKCSATAVSGWSVAGTFTTGCVVFTAPYSQNFDTTPTGSSTNNVVPPCWSYLETAGLTAYGYVSASALGSAPNNFYMYNAANTTGDVMLVSPQTSNLSDGTKRVRFLARSGGANYTVEVGTLTNPLDPTTFTIIGTPISLTTTYTEFIRDIPAGTNQYLAFRHGLGGTNRSVYLDDIFVENIPTCFEPTNISVTAHTNATGTLTWTAPTAGNAPQTYTVYYSTTNTPPTPTTVLNSTNSVTVAGTAATISGLAPSTMYYVWVRSNCSSTDSSIWTQNPVTFATDCLPPSVTSVTGQTVCLNHSATLTAAADPGATLTWYDAATGGTVLGTGTSYTTPVLTATTNYYVSASTASTASAGLPNAISTSGYTLEAGLFFDALNAFTLQGVYVYPLGTGAGDVVIALQDGSVSPATTIQTITVNLTGSASPVKTYVPLNWNIAAGTNYKLMMISRSGGVASLIRESGSSWGAYPLGIPGLLNITNGNCCSGNTTSTSYYYFYDWQISSACESPRTVVTATVNPDPSCSMSTVETGAEAALSIYPNPFSDVVNIADVKDVASVTVTDMAGRTVRSFAKVSGQLHLGELKSGMYIITLKMKDGSSKAVKAIKR